MQQTDFKYTLTSMLFDNLRIQTLNSKLIGALEFNYKREDLKEFTDKVLLSGNFTKSTVNLGELNVFFPEFGASENVTFDTKISGTLNDLSLQNLRLSTNRSTYISGQFAFKNLINLKRLCISVTCHRLNIINNIYNYTVIFIPIFTYPNTTKSILQFRIHCHKYYFKFFY